MAEPSDLEKLKKDVVASKDLKYVMDAITLTRHKLEGKCPLIGFSGAPVSEENIFMKYFGCGNARKFTEGW